MAEDATHAEPAREDAFELARFLRDHREEILERWVRATRTEGSIRDLDDRRLIDHLPLILDEIAEAMEARGKGTPKEVEVGPAAHAREREQQGFSLSELVSEYRLLRRSMLEICRDLAPLLLLSTVTAVNDAIDEAVARSAARFTRERERTLESLDQLAATEVGGASLDELLHNLLRVLVERVTAVDGAALLLREGDRLRLRASAGLAEPLGATLAIGEGFAGTVAAQREPRMTRSAATDPVLYGTLYRRHGVRALYGVPLIDERGEVIGVATIASLTLSEFTSEEMLLVRTLTRRATALIAQHLLREAAEERARRLRHAETLMAVHPDLFWIFDRAHRISWANLALLRMWGRPLEQVVGRTLEELEYPPQLVEAIGRNLERVFQKGETIQDATAYTSPTGVSGVFEYIMAPVMGEGGQVEAAAGVARDVSERFQAEQARADALARERSAREEAEQTVALLDSLLTGSPAGIAFIGSDLRYVRINDALATVNGLSAQAHVGRHISEVLPGDNSRMLEPLLHRVLQTGEPLVNLETQGAPPSTPGVVRAFLGNFFPVRVRGGDIIGVGVVAMEITDRKRMEEELRQSVTIRERVMSILGHDLRGPLSVVSAGAAVLRRSAALGDQEQRTVARITRAVDRMARMIRDLLDYARATGGGLPIDRRPVNLRAIARGALDELHAAFPDAQLHLDAVDCTRDGEWDPDRITQLLMNLLTNAVQYSPPGSPIVLRLFDEPDRVVLEVHNGGPPIPKSALPHLFEPFHRSAASDATAPGGLGLGLFIVKQIAEGHGGAVWVRSTAEKGTTFTVSLPRR